MVSRIRTLPYAFIVPAAILITSVIPSVGRETAAPSASTSLETASGEFGIPFAGLLNPLEGWPGARRGAPHTVAGPVSSTAANPADAPTSEQPQDAVEAGGISVVDAGEPTAIEPASQPEAALVMHVVAPGDTLRAIAAKFSVAASDIASANALTNPDRIKIGDALLIPTSNSATISFEGHAARDAREAFIFQLVPGAQVSQAKTRVPASVTIAQGILESFWGTSYLAREANNLFGVKAQTKSGPAGVVWIDAWEVENGRDVTRSEPFRKYNSVAESVADHGNFFIENSRYQDALLATDDPREFARRINAAGYATDPAYATKLIAYMDRYDLYRYDLR